MSVYSKHKASELLGVLFLASSLLLFLSLVSYNALDSSGNVAASAQHYSNYVGQIGAWLSDLLFQVMGFSALCIPLPLLFIGYRKIRARESEFPLLKLAGFSTILAAFSAGLTLISPTTLETVHFSSGGILGVMIVDWLSSYLNIPGSSVVIVTVFVLSLMVTTRFSLDLILNWLANRNWNLFGILSGQFENWRKRRNGKKKLARLGKRTLVTHPAPKKVVFDEPVLPEKREAGPGREQAPTVTVTKVAAPVPSTEAASETTFTPLPGSPLSLPYQPPPFDFLQAALGQGAIDEPALIERAQIVAAKCAEFDVHGRVLQIHPGPVVTTFEFKPDPGVKYSRVTTLAEDLCLALKAESVRIDRIPGKNTVGIEVPNLQRQGIYLREILEATAFQQSPSKLTLGLGKLINGNTYVTDLARMPHLLVAGATGSGKSVAVNCMVCSILYKAGPADVRFIMIDPKRLELGVYEEIPHLLTPIVTDPKQAANALNWAVAEMEERYRLLAQEGVRNIDQYNRLVGENSQDPERLQPLPYIVIIVDELADLMMTTGKDVEASITRLAQMARAIGIHLILATQRPSVDVLTGLIKANFPCRLSFRVSSRVDSRTILDSNGAEQLLGHGDMLFLPPGTARLIRIHGGFISEREIHQLTDFLKQQSQPEYREEVLAGAAGDKESALVRAASLEDELYPEAVRFIVETGKASTSLLQRRLRIGYGRAARILDMMEHEGLIGPPEGSKAREVLVPPDYFKELDETRIE